MKKIVLLLAILVILASCTVKKDGSIGGDLKIGGSAGIPKKDCVCIQLYDPVCGTDGKTYSNNCFANCAGVEFTKGSC